MQNAKETWLLIPANISTCTKLLHNVWCTSCQSAVEIVDYVIREHDFGIVLKGKCSICGHDVTGV